MADGTLGAAWPETGATSLKLDHVVLAAGRARYECGYVLQEIESDPFGRSADWVVIKPSLTRIVGRSAHAVFATA
jgi:hypothetical protein